MVRKKYMNLKKKRRGTKKQTELFSRKKSILGENQIALKKKQK